MPGRRYTYSRSPDQPYALEMLPLSDRERTALLAEARSSHRKLFAAMAAAQEGGDAACVAGVTNETSEAAAKAILACSTTTAFGSLEEVASLYVSRDSSIVLDFAESKPLYSFEEPNKLAPMRYAGMRWSRWKSPSKLVSDRDLLYVEFMDAFTEPETGRRGWARCTRSIVHACCPESQHPYGPVRAELFCSGMILRETDEPGVLELSTLVHLDTRGVPSFLAQKMLHTFKASAHNVSHVLKLVRLMNSGGSADDLLSDEAADDRACRSCSAHVSKWTRARHCRHCDAILCKTCAEISYAGVIEGKTTRMCVDCGSGKRPDLPRTRHGTGALNDASRPVPYSPSEATHLSDSSLSNDYFSRSKIRNGSSRSIDTESVDSQRDDGDAVLEQMNSLSLRKSSSSTSSSRVGTPESQSRRQQTYLLYPPSQHHQHQQQQQQQNQQQRQQQPNLQRINHPRSRGTSLLTEVAPTTQPRKDAAPMMDLSYLNDLVGTKAK